MPSSRGWLTVSVTTSLDAGSVWHPWRKCTTLAKYSTSGLDRPPTPERLAERSTFWFGGDDAAAVAARDVEIRTKLEPLLERASRGEFANWAASPKRRLALIILFDQVPRNAYRGTAAAFAFDREALMLTVEGMQLAADAALEPLERLFFYLPLEHAESMEAQDAAVEALERLVSESPRGAARLHRVLRNLCAQTSRGHREVRAIPASQRGAEAREHRGGDRVAGERRPLRPVMASGAGRGFRVREEDGDCRLTGANPETPSRHH